MPDTGKLAQALAPDTGELAQDAVPSLATRSCDGLNAWLWGRVYTE